MCLKPLPVRKRAALQMLDTGRLALLQMPNEPTVLPDMVLTGRLLLQSLQRLHSPQRSPVCALPQARPASCIPALPCPGTSAGPDMSLLLDDMAASPISKAPVPPGCNHHSVWG